MENLQKKLINIFIEKKKQILSFFTFTLPQEFRDQQKMLPVVFHNLLKRHDFGIYIYSFELNDKTKGLHIHLASSNDFKLTFLQVKKNWFLLLQKHYNAKLPNSYLVATSDYKEITHTWESVIEDFLKQIYDISTNKEIFNIFSPEKTRLYGGSKLFSKFFAEYRSCFFENIPESFPVKKKNDGPLNENQIESLFQAVLQEYLIDYPNVPIPLIKQQFQSELFCYTDVFYTYNIDDFIDFITSATSQQSQFYVEFYQFLNKLFSKSQLLNNCKELLNQFFNAQKFSHKNVVNKILMLFFSWDTDLKSVSISDQTLVYIFINITHILHKSQYLLKLNVLHKLAAFVLKKVALNFDAVIIDEANLEKNKTRLGHIMFSLFEIVCGNNLKNEISFHEELVSFVESKNVITDIEDLEPKVSSNYVNLKFSENAVDSLKERFKFKKDMRLNLLSVQKPMCIPPKKWKKNQVCFIKNNVEYYDAAANYTGGLLLNGFLIKRPLCKTGDVFSKHSLAITEQILTYVNRMQQQELVLDQELVDYYLNNKHTLPGFLNAIEKKTISARVAQIRINLHSLYKDKKKVPSLQTKISTLSTELDTLISKLKENSLLLRLLHILEQILSYTSLYYTYEFDFRMRLYCNPFELSFMGSKLIRSVIRFKESTCFDSESFSLYSSLQYSACRDLSEVAILEFFYTKIEFLLKESQKIIKEAREPFLFLACCFEWKRFLLSKKKNNVYLSNFPVYLDCSANGPQIISLVFALEEFGRFLNLQPQTKNDIRGDFYSILINRFFVFQKNQNWLFLEDVKLDLLTSIIPKMFRPALKTVIMTQFYGISYRNFSSHIKANFIRSKEEFSKIFNLNEKNFFTFIDEFISHFWKYLHSLPLFQLELLLSKFQKLAKGDVNLVNWSVFDVNIISMFYKKIQKKQSDSQFLDRRTQYVLYTSEGEAAPHKQRSAFMANFVHSLDAFVLFKTCSELEFGILPIHDSFGVHSCDVIALKTKIKSVFGMLVHDRFAAKFFINQLSEAIEEATDSSVKQEFLHFVEQHIKFGVLQKEDVDSSFYYIYYS